MQTAFVIVFCVVAWAMVGVGFARYYLNGMADALDKKSSVTVFGREDAQTVAAIMIFLWPIVGTLAAAWVTAKNLANQSLAARERRRKADALLAAQEAEVQAILRREGLDS